MERGKKSLFRRTILIETWAILVRFFSLKMMRRAAKQSPSMPHICRFLPASVCCAYRAEKPESTHFRGRTPCSGDPPHLAPQTSPVPVSGARCGLTRRFYAPRAVQRHATRVWRTFLARFRASFIFARNSPISARKWPFLASFCPLSRLLRAVFGPKPARYPRFDVRE